MKSRDIASQSIKTLNDGQRRSLEAEVKRKLRGDLDHAKARAEEIPTTIRMLGLRFEIEAEQLTPEEVTRLEADIESLIEERDEALRLIDTLPARINLYRAAGRPQPTFTLTR